MPTTKCGDGLQPRALKLEGVIAEEVETANHESASQRDITNPRRTDLADVKSALLLGIDDFQALRTYVIFRGIVYALLGLVLIGLSLATVWCGTSSH